MLADANRSLLLVVDIQERLLPAMSDGEAALKNACILLKAAREIGVPVLASEQYPAGLGPSVPEIAALLDPAERLAKMEFSCFDNDALRSRIVASGRDQVIVTGLEAHVCVFQTAVGLSAAGFQTMVAVDATGSRQPANKEIACGRLAAAGIGLTSTEMVAFEWLRTAAAPAFRAVSKLVR